MFFLYRQKYRRISSLKACNGGSLQSSSPAAVAQGVLLRGV